MSKHRAEPPPRVRPRLGRMAAAALALSVTGVALLSGIGVINLDGGPASAASGIAPKTSVSAVGSAPVGSAPLETDAATPNHEAKQAPPTATPPVTQPTPNTTSSERVADPLPSGTGTGRRVVFSIEDQRVWLVDKDNQPISTYLVSGSLTNNLRPGTYNVYSKSRWANGIDDSGVMQYFVRFTRGQNAPIGFHSIPTKDGSPLQTEKQLGTPQSHGCIRQRLADAERLWDFAPVGTDVVVI